MQRNIKLTLLLLLTFCSSYKNHAQNSINYSDQVDKYFVKIEEFFLRDKDSLYLYLNKLKVIASQEADIKNLCDAYNYECWAASSYGEIDRIEFNIKSLDSLMLIHKIKLNALPDKIYYQCQFEYTKGQYYYELTDYKTSLLHFNRLLLKSNEQSNLEPSESLFNLILESNIYIGLIHKNEGKFELAREYFEKTIRLAKEKEAHQSELNNAYLHIANIFTQEGNFKKSNRIILKSIKTKRSNSNRTLASFFRIIENHLNLKQLDSAKFYLNRLKKEFTENHSMYDRIHKANSKIYEADYDYENALVALQQNLKFLQRKWTDKNNPEIAEAHIIIGEFYERTNNFEKALDNYKLALNQFSEDSINSTINQTLKFKILKHKTIVLNQLEDYKTSLETSKTAISILDSLKPSFHTNSDKLFLIENAFPLFENGIEAAYKLFQETKDSNYIDQAFIYSEKSKSTLLLESLLSSQATTFANIPDDLIEKEKQLKTKITYLEKQINKKPSNDLKDKLFDIKQTHRSLIQEIEANYKDYYDLKYNTQVLTPSTLQKWLDKETVLVSYFYGNKTIYSITITKNSKHIEALKINPNFETLLNDTYSLLSNPKSNINKLQLQTNELYQKLLKPALSNIKKKHIIIVPDGLLNYLPFESFVDNSSNYLIENHSISYINSATLLLQLQRHKENNNQVLAFAPSFENSTISALLPLPNNAEEVTQILSHFNGKTFINNNASLKNFNDNTNNFGIIHLATHAVLDDKHPEYSYLAFTPEASEEYLLYINDLYNLELNSNMVTLSACETGLGDLKKGEGMMSLARGFYFSGTSSIASTLWKVNDASSSQLMNDFYGQLSKGKTKSRALQNAKLKFLKDNKDTGLSHPYYWSGFIISGNTDTLVSNLSWIYITLGVIAMIGLLFVLFKRKRNV